MFLGATCKCVLYIPFAPFWQLKRTSFFSSFNSTLLWLPLEDNCKPSCQSLARTEVRYRCTHWCTEPLASLPSGSVVTGYRNPVVSHRAATHTKFSRVWEPFCLDTMNKNMTWEVCKEDLVYNCSTSVNQKHLKNIYIYGTVCSLIATNVWKTWHNLNKSKLTSEDILSNILLDI